MISYNWRLNIATMLFFTFIQIVIPLIPRYAVVMNISPFIIGLAISTMSITAIIVRPVGGILSDKWSRKNIMIISVILASIAYIILSLSKDVETIIISRIIEGVAIALFVPSSIASAIDYAPQGRIGEALGWRSLTIGVGFSLGPSLGGFMAEVLGYNNTFMITSLLLPSIIPIIISCKECPHQQTPKSSNYLMGLKEQHFLLALITLIIYSTAWMGLLTFLSAYLKIENYGDLEIGMFIAIQAIVSIIIRVFAGRLSDIKPYLTTTIGLFIISISFFAIYIFEVPPLLYIASLIFGIGVGIYIPASQTLALAKAPAHNRGFLSSIYIMGMDIGNLSGPIIFGAIIERFNSYHVAFLIAPILLLITTLILLPYSIKNEIKVCVLKHQK